LVPAIFSTRIEEINVCRIGDVVAAVLPGMRTVMNKKELSKDKYALPTRTFSIVVGVFFGYLET